MPRDSLSPDLIAERLRAHGLAPGPGVPERLARYLALLGQWNRVHNLTGARDPEDLVERHLVESLALTAYLRGPNLADVGSGGGLPGIPLAIANPALEFVLIESRRKRASFLRQVKLELELANVEVRHARAETLELPPFATVLARAVASPAALLALVRPMLALGGRLVLLTSRARAGAIVELAGDFREVPTATGPVDLKSTIVVLERLALS